MIFLKLYMYEAEWIEGGHFSEPITLARRRCLMKHYLQCIYVYIDIDRSLNQWCYRHHERCTNEMKWNGKSRVLAEWRVIGV